MRRIAFATSLMFVLGGSLAAPAIAADCPGDPGYQITLEPEVAVGSTFELGMTAPVGSTVALFASLGEGPTPTPYGTVCLDFPALINFVFVMPAPGSVSVTHFMHCEPSIVGFQGFFQLIGVDFAHGTFGVSNQAPLTVVDGACHTCCEYGKPKLLRIQYTGSDCSATSHNQKSDKVSCAGDPMGTSPVRILCTDKDDPSDSSAKVWFDGEVSLGEYFDASALNAGEDDFKNETYVYTFDLNGTLLQAVEFHTSCSQPLNVGDQFGASRIIGCVGKDEPIPGDCCAEGKPIVLTMEYTGESCAATSHLQDADKVSCTGDPMGAPQVFVKATNKSNPFDGGAKVWFAGLVDLGAAFDIAASHAGEDKFSSETHVHVFSADQSTVLQSVEFHTSCSQPLFVGNQFGSMKLIGCIGEDTPNPNDCCDDGKPVTLTMEYTGDSCAATNHSQDSGKVSCSGDPMGAAQVFVRATDKANPADGGARVWFAGLVDLGATFDIAASHAGEDKLENETHIHVYSADQTTLLQSVEFHTSCSQPLLLGNQFGSMKLVGCTSENTPDPNDCCDAGKPKVLTLEMTGGSCADSSHGQASGKWSCSGGEVAVPAVFVVVNDQSDPNDDGGKVYFAGGVPLGGTFDADASADGFGSNTYAHIFDASGVNLIQTAHFHTSCSTPLKVGDRFGAITVVACQH